MEYAFLDNVNVIKVFMGKVAMKEKYNMVNAKIINVNVMKDGVE